MDRYSYNSEIIVKKKKILYFSHVSWGWIKQRPHFVAECLSKYFDVTFIYPKFYKKNMLVKNEGISIKKLSIWNIFDKIANYSPIIDSINGKLIKIQIFFLLYKYKTSILWFTHPHFFEYLYNKELSNRFVIYDCMDDCLAFPDAQKNGLLKNRLYFIEKKLCEISNIIFTSSKVLKDRLSLRYGLNNDKIFVVNNGYSPLKKIELPKKLKKAFSDNLIKVTYIGTISEWLDMPLLFKALNYLKNIKIILVGPSEIKIPHHDGLIFMGPVEHDYLNGLMMHSDILIMPFISNELTKAVDPVKMYEYISAGKPVIAKKYEETEKFKDCVYLYSTDNEFIEILKRLIDNNLPSLNSDLCNKLLANALWEKRIEEMFRIISQQIEVNI